MPLGVSFPQLVVLPSILLIASGIALFSFQNVYVFLSTNLNKYSTIPIVKTLRPYITNVRLALEQVIGKASSLKFTFSHVLTMGVILVLLAIYNAIQRNNELQEQRLKLELVRKSNKNKRE